MAVDGYKLYRALQSGGPYTLVADIPVESLPDPENPTFTDTNGGAGFEEGVTYHWVVTAYKKGTTTTEGPYSNEVKGMVASPNTLYLLQFVSASSANLYGTAKDSIIAGPATWSLLAAITTRRYRKIYVDQERQIIIYLAHNWWATAPLSAPGVLTDRGALFSAISYATSYDAGRGRVYQAVNGFIHWTDFDGISGTVGPYPATNPYCLEYCAEDDYIYYKAQNHPGFFRNPATGWDYEECGTADDYFLSSLKRFVVSPDENAIYYPDDNLAYRTTISFGGSRIALSDAFIRVGSFVSDTDGRLINGGNNGELRTIYRDGTGVTARVLGPGNNIDSIELLYIPE